jgi:hypothetical protein
MRQSRAMTEKYTTAPNKRVCAISLSQFLHHTWTVLSRHKAYRPFSRFVKPALDSSFNRDSLIFRRDWQKLRHGGSPAGTVFWLKYRDSNRRAVPPPLSAHTRWPLAARQSATRKSLYITVN